VVVLGLDENDAREEAAKVSMAQNGKVKSEGSAKDG
jgi:hypothetical protein